MGNPIDLIYIIKTHDKQTGKLEGILGYAFDDVQKALKEAKRRDRECQFFNHTVSQVVIRNE